MQGLVLKTTGSWYDVENNYGEIIPCRIRGQLRLKGIDSTTPCSVGDQVEYEMVEHNSGVINSILPRKNYIIRKSVKLSKQSHILAANVDRAWLIVTPVFPKTSTGFIDRFIAATESFRIPVTLLFNKSDLFKDDSEEVQNDYISIYESLGYACLRVSTVTNEGIDELRNQLTEKINLFAGHSGVGKSSLINAIEPSLNLKVGGISRQHHKGKHTTTFAEMHRITNGGHIIDTPGIKEFVNIDFAPAEIGHYFVEMRERLNQCHYNNCLHDSEKDCAIKKAVEAGEINPMRYYNYLSMLRNEDIFR